ncbi:MAG: hypothetical protein R3C46_12780 [Hyphomonadaceae bacterium]
MKRFLGLLGGCAALALAACGDPPKEEPKPMELGPDTAKIDVVPTVFAGEIIAGNGAVAG